MRSLVLAALSLASCTREPTVRPVRVAAAADLSHAFEALGRDFERETGTPVSFSFGSSGLLAKQVREGAPFDVFAAANATLIDDVVSAGVCDPASKRRYARGRLVLWSKRGLVAPPTSLEDLADARFRRIAIANPRHAPYGVAAKQALERAGVLAAVEPRLVLGENVRQTLQFAETGNAEAALVALALVVDDHDDPSVLVPDTLHEPIDQALAVCTHGSNRVGGDAFARYVTGAAGQAVLQRAGFSLPSPEVAR